MCFLTADVHVIYDWDLVGCSLFYVCGLSWCGLILHVFFWWLFCLFCSVFVSFCCVVINLCLFSLLFVAAFLTVI